MSKWINKKIVSCGKILRLQANVTECQCPKCKRWCLKWADTNDYEKCPHCGQDMRGGEGK
jgi:predicted RNA-binding Zn-ribbon protein involved in translation (DUF1610 family)